MFVKLLSLVDFVCLLILFFHVAFGLFSIQGIIIIPYYFMLKGAVFSLTKDIASVIDVLCSIYILMLLYGAFSHTALTVIVFLWFFQKTVFGIL